MAAALVLCRVYVRENYNCHVWQSTSYFGDNWCCAIFKLRASMVVWREVTMSSYVRGDVVSR